MRVMSLLLVGVALLSLFSAIDASCEGSVKGDPYFTGFQGQNYVLSGEPGSVYNLFSDQHIYVGVEIGVANPERSYGTVIKSVEIGYFLEEGVATSFQVFSDSVNETDLSVGIVISEGSSSTSVAFNNQDQLFEDACMEVFWKNRVLTFINPTHKIEVAFQKMASSYINGTYLDVTVHHPEESSDRTQGLLGQSAAAESVISRNAQDYLLNGPEDALSLDVVTCSTTFIAGAKKVVSTSMKAPLGSSCNNDKPKYYFDITDYDTTTSTFIVVPKRTNGLIGAIRLNTESNDGKDIVATSMYPQLYSEFPTYHPDTQIITFEQIQPFPSFDVFTFTWTATKHNFLSTSTVTLSRQIRLRFCDVSCPAGLAPTEHPADLSGEDCTPPAEVPDFSFDPLEGDFTDFVAYQEYLSSGAAAGSCSNDDDVNQCLSCDAGSDCYYCSIVGDGCVTGDAAILMADGTTRPASEIKEGDQLMGNDGQP